MSQDFSPFPFSGEMNMTKKHVWRDTTQPTPMQAPAEVEFSAGPIERPVGQTRLRPQSSLRRERMDPEDPCRLLVSLTDDY